MHPRVELLFVLAGDKEAAVFGDELKAVCFQVRSGYCRDILQRNNDNRMRS
jgi:hypothetical protein